MLVFHFRPKKYTFYVIKIRNFADPKTQKCNFDYELCGVGWQGYKPKRPPIVGYINMQKCLPEISAFGYKSMAKIANLCDNNCQITHPPGPQLRGQYFLGQGP